MRVSGMTVTLQDEKEYGGTKGEETHDNPLHRMYGTLWIPTQLAMPRSST